MKISSIFKNKEAKQPWQWPSCNNPKTISFRVSDNENYFKTVNSVFFDPTEGQETLESISTNSCSECVGLSTNNQSELDNNNNNIIISIKDNNCPEDTLEDIIRGLRSSERLFFDPDDTSLLVKEAKNGDHQAMLPFKESIALALESDDPYTDFKRSMQEMVETHGLNKDWDCLEEMLVWYLKMNGKTNHGVIVGAFVDVLIDLAASSSDNNDNNPNTTCSDSSSYSSMESCFSSPSSPLSPTIIVCHGDCLENCM